MDRMFRLGVLVICGALVVGCTGSRGGMNRGHRRAYEVEPTPPDVLAMQDEVITIRASGPAGQVRTGVSVDVRPLARKLGEVRDPFVVLYSTPIPHLVKSEYDADAGLVRADLVAGKTYLVFSKLDKDWVRIYALLCRIRLLFGPGIVDPICRRILCNGESFANAAAMIEEIPELRAAGAKPDALTPHPEDPIGLPPHRPPGMNVCDWCIRMPIVRVIPVEECLAPQPPGLAKDPLIVFQSAQSGDLEIYTMRPDGSNAQNVTSSAGWDGWPVWSPDGARIGFMSQRGNGSFDIYTMKHDGTDVVRVTDNPGSENLFSWAPSGRLYFRADWTGRWDLYYMDPAASSPTGFTAPVALTDAGENMEINDFAEAPDKARIAVLWSRPHHSETTSQSWM